MTLRNRVTLVTAALIVAASSILGAITYTLAGRIQMNAIDQDLYVEISEARIKSLIDNPRPPQDGIFVNVALGRVNREGDNIRQLRPAGTLDEPIAVPPLNAEQISQATDGPITVDDAGNRFRVAVRSHGSGLSTVVAAAPLAAYDESMALLGRATMLGAAIVMLLGAFVTWVAVRRAFRPMDAVVVSARRIAAGDTTHRLPASRAGTEIGDLSSGMNLMIDSLAAAIDRVQASEERLRAFVSAASHEIRTPLTVIRGYSEILAAESGSRSAQEMRALERICSETKRLDDLVTGLLVLQRSSVPPGTNFEEVDVATIAREAFEDLRALEPTRPVTVRVDPEMEVALVWGDLEGVIQLFANIVQNIQRHTPADSAVEVSISRVDESVRVLVDDSGPGLIEQTSGECEHPRRDARGSGGFGLGMSIMNAVVRAHSGTLVTAKSPTGGLRLIIDLPRIG